MPRGRLVVGGGHLVGGRVRRLLEGESVLNSRRPRRRWGVTFPPSVPFSTLFVGGVNFKLVGSSSSRHAGLERKMRTPVGSGGLFVSVPHRRRQLLLPKMVPTMIFVC